MDTVYGLVNQLPYNLNEAHSDYSKMLAANFAIWFSELHKALAKNVC